MRRERRTGVSPLPSRAELEEILTVDQLLTVTQMESFGWALEIVRRPKFQPPVPLIKNTATSKWAAVEPDGSLDPIFCLRDGDMEVPVKQRMIS